MDIYMYSIEQEWTKTKEHFAESPRKTDAAETNAAETNAAETNAAETDAAGDNSAAVDDAAIDAAMIDAAMDDTAMDDAAMDDAATDGAGLLVRCPIRVDADSDVSPNGETRRTMTTKCVMEVVTHIEEEHGIDEKVREDKYKTSGGGADMSHAE